MKFSYEQLSSAETIRSCAYSNLKIISDGCYHHLDRMDLCSYFSDDPEIYTQDFLPTMLVFVDKDDRTIDIYIAPHEPDKYDSYREIILHQEREARGL
jgi:hypothetical protein